MMNRREWLKMAGCGFMAWNMPWVMAGEASRPKLIWVLLRGGMDSLHAILPTADDNLMRQRKSLVAPVIDNALDLGHGFALHPAFRTLHQLYQDQQLLPIVATASGNKTRSHFKAQDILECGLPELDHDNGWLNRAMKAYQGEGLAVSHSIPISLRGQQLAKTWYPDSLPAAEEDLYSRLEALYEGDELLKSRLLDGLQTRQQLGDMAGGNAAQKFPKLADACAKLMAQKDGPDCAMLEMGGWDTHKNATARLNRQFKELDQGIAKLQQGLGKQWSQTVVMVATEFGRTVAENGTSGTDHGTASAMFVAGGAVQGGNVLGQWPGLAKRDLYEGRDLRPTSDIRQWISAVLHQHWGLKEAQLMGVFPGVLPMDRRIIRLPG